MVHAMFAPSELSETAMEDVRRYRINVGNGTPMDCAYLVMEDICCQKEHVLSLEGCMSKRTIDCYSLSCFV